LVLKFEITVHHSAVIDPTSPIFMRGDTIHIPCIFISWTGHALDEKTPLLRAEQV
jgi:glutamine synthetase